MELKNSPSKATVDVSLTKWFVSGCCLEYEFIISELQQRGYIERRCDYQKFQSTFHDTIVNQAVPLETILEVNEMLLELGKTTMDVVNEVNEDVNTEDNEEKGDGSENSSDEIDVFVG